MNTNPQSPAPIANDPESGAEFDPNVDPLGKSSPPQDELPEFGPETALNW